MPEREYLSTGSIPAPLAVGRLVRFVFGSGLVFFVAWSARYYRDWTDFDGINLGIWIPLGISLLLLTEVVNVGLGRDWGRKPLVVTVAAGLVLFIAGAIAYGQPWSPPLAWGLFAFTMVIMGWLGVSFVLASFFRVPG